MEDLSFKNYKIFYKQMLLVKVVFEGQGNEINDISSIHTRILKSDFWIDNSLAAQEEVSKQLNSPNRDSTINLILNDFSLLQNWIKDIKTKNPIINTFEPLDGEKIVFCQRNPNTEGAFELLNYHAILEAFKRFFTPMFESISRFDNRPKALDINDLPLNIPVEIDSVELNSEFKADHLAQGPNKALEFTRPTRETHKEIFEKLEESFEKYLENHDSRMKEYMAKYAAEEIDYLDDECNYWNPILRVLEEPDLQFDYGNADAFDVAAELIDDENGKKIHISIRRKVRFLKNEKNSLKNRVDSPRGNSFTQKELALMFHFFLKSQGIYPTKTRKTPTYAKFMHLLNGTKFTKIQNSELNTKLKKAPYFEGISDAKLIKDLESIQSKFENVNLKVVVKEIEREIESIKRSTE